MSRVELHDGYRRLLSRLYSYQSYHQRAMALILHKGVVPHARLLAQPGDIGLSLRVLWHCVLRASPRRAWFTLSLIAETALRRPRAVRDAVTLALLHKHVHEYTRNTSTNIGHLVQEIRPPAALTAQPS